MKKWIINMMDGWTPNKKESCPNPSKGCMTPDCRFYDPDRGICCLSTAIPYPANDDPMQDKCKNVGKLCIYCAADKCTARRYEKLKLL